MKRTPEQLLALGQQMKVAAVKAAAARAMTNMASEYSPWEAIVWTELLKEAKAFKSTGVVGDYMSAEIGGKYATANDLADAIIANSEAMKNGRAFIILARQAKIAAIEAFTVDQMKELENYNVDF